jgi:His-Xaa-Ser system radical SAM maturase HxsC
MASRLAASGHPGGHALRVLGRACRTDSATPDHGDFVRIVGANAPTPQVLNGYAAALFEGAPPQGVTTPHVHDVGSLDFIGEDCILAVDSGSGHVRVLYRPDSRHNFLFATERCSSACIMCSQPPRDVDTSDAPAELLRIISLITNKPEYLGITGGEPTLLGHGLIDVISALKERLPDTSVVMLSNGRTYCYESYVQKLAAVGHPKFVTSIPIYGDNAADHDYVVQVAGAFDQTIQGLYNAAKHQIGVELRVVLQRPTIPILLRLAEFVYRNLPFVQRVALMGLEEMGLARTNRELLWIDPVDYAEALAATVRYLHYRRIGVSVYNLPLCVLPRELWPFACQSISDHKNCFLETCQPCRVKPHCAGFFESGLARPSRGIRPIV